MNRCDSSMLVSTLSLDSGSGSRVYGRLEDEGEADDELSTCRGILSRSDSISSNVITTVALLAA